jgi:hypothetical protein
VGSSKIVPEVASQAATAGDNRQEARLGQAVARQLLGLGVHDPQVTVERRPKLPRSAGGRLQLVIADPTARPARADARRQPSSGTESVSSWKWRGTWAQRSVGTSA